MRKVAVIAIVVGALGYAAPAHAAPHMAPASNVTSPGSMNNEISIFGLTAPYDTYASAGAGFGVGARYQITLVPEGVIGASRVRDDIGIEFGLDWFHYSWNDPFFAVSWTYNEVAPVVGGVWNFWFTPRFAIYPKIDLLYRIGWWSSNVPGAASPGGFGGFDVQGAAGIIYKFDKVALRAEIGSYSIRLGIGF
jgi:hypothetical protein